MGTKTRGQIAYEADCKARPAYDDGSRRKAWEHLGSVERLSWERNPTPRTWGASVLAVGAL